MESEKKEKLALDVLDVPTISGTFQWMPLFLSIYILNSTWHRKTKKCFFEK